MNATVDPAIVSKPHLRPRGDHVVIVPLRAEQRTETRTESGIYLNVRESAGGIALPDSIDNTYAEGTVVALGDGWVEGCPDCSPEGRAHTFEVAIGDRVLWTPWAAVTVTLEEVEYNLVSESDILGIFR